jgi:hypothetical protein
MLSYNVLLNRRHGLPVRTVVVLLRREADGPEMTDSVRHALPDGRPYLEFRYDVTRIWQKPVEEILAGGVGTLPLAPIAQVAENELPGVIHRMQERFVHEVTRAEAATLWAETSILMGLALPGSFGRAVVTRSPGDGRIRDLPRDYPQGRRARCD